MSLYSIGLSGLSAAQNALSTTSNNISNVYTDGYSRQLTLLGQNGSGNGASSGVSVDGIQRQYNGYISSQLNQVNSRQSALETYQSQVNQVDDLLADSDSGLTTLMQKFFSSVEDLTGAPADAAAREGLLGSSRSMAAQFRAYDDYLGDMREGINGQIGGVVSQVNNLSDQIADLNKQVTLARARSGEEPNALLDQRDKLVSDLGELVDVNVQVQDGSTYQVSLSNGMPLVAGNKSFDLVAVKNSEDPSSITIAYEDGAGSRSPLKESVIKGGELGGLLSFRSETLDSAQNQLGQLAVTLAKSFNTQHQAGVDLNGDDGEAFFDIGSPTAISRSSNAGTGSLSAEYGDVSQLTSDDYRLTYQADGSYSVENLGSGDISTVSPDADGKLSVGGVTLTPSGNPAEGDVFMLQPTRNAAAGFDVALSDTSKIAAADGDSGGSGDNRNALALLDLQSQKLVGGSATLSGGYAAMVSDVGNRASITQANLTTQEGLSDQLYAYQQADSGVNLDEEYANLMKYQQYYSANAKIIEAGSTILDTILGLRA
ncbi:flagellar hook-associated protein FlgK [Salinicola halimionae]|uniref:flagellar hook-associated protein FlgK n=1 Tax=Salinicola halimionae TaxID=1949081 RepID=UPI000DA140A6|nr:flagellar hook-associated protein FlgK [Salinicola halimionae]